MKKQQLGDPQPRRRGKPTLPSWLVAFSNLLSSSCVLITLFKALCDLKVLKCHHQTTSPHVVYGCSKSLCLSPVHLDQRYSSFELLYQRGSQVDDMASIAQPVEPIQTLPMVLTKHLSNLKQVLSLIITLSPTTLLV